MNLIKKVLAVAVLFLVPAFAKAQSCTQTFNTATVGSSPYPGSAVNTAIQSGSGGETFCFASGSYGAIDLYGAHPSGTGQIILTPAPGATVTGISFNLNGVSNIAITGFTSPSSLDGGVLMQVSGNGSNTGITVFNNAMPSTGVQISGNTVPNANILITGNTLVGYASSGEEDRLHIYGNGCPDGITVSNNLMSGGESDGIQYGDCGLQILNNVISNIHENSCNGIHCDAIQDGGGGQDVVISGNFIYNDSDCFLLDDGSTNTTIENNVCTTDGEDNYWMQFGGAKTIILNHNTILSTAGAQYGNDHNNNPSSNVTFINNIWASEPSQNSGQPPSGTFTDNYNLCITSCTDSEGSQSLRGTPSFVGGISPTTYAGFALTSTSLGHVSGNDGNDIGINVTGVVQPPPPPPPTQVSIQTVSLATGTVGASYTTSLTATGGTTPYNFTASPLPAGLSLSGSTISGTPSASGTTQVVVTVTDKSNPVETASVTLSLTVNAAAPPPPPPTCNSVAVGCQISTNSSANIRATAVNNGFGTQIGTEPAKTIGTVLAISTDVIPNTGGAVWVEVQFSNLTGWMGSNNMTVVTAPVPTLTIAPTTATVVEGGTVQFTANETNTTATIVWSVNAPGGLFTAPAITGKYTVTATAGALTVSATVTVTAPPPSATVSVSGDVITIVPKNIPSGTPFTGTINIDGVQVTFSGASQ